MYKVNILNKVNFKERIDIASKMVSTDDEISEINPLVIENILIYLQNFEKNKKFLDKNVSLTTMSVECCTNKSYLSKIINHYKNENFVSYLNNLRLNYVVEEWKVNQKSRYFPIQEIAEKTGFSSAQSFSRNFRERYGISPTYFLKRLDKETELKAS